MVVDLDIPYRTIEWNNRLYNRKVISKKKGQVKRTALKDKSGLNVFIPRWLLFRISRLYSRKIRYVLTFALNNSFMKGMRYREKF